MGHVYHGYVSLLGMGHWDHDPGLNSAPGDRCHHANGFSDYSGACDRWENWWILFETGNLNRLNLFGKNRMGCNIEVVDNLVGLGVIHLVRKMMIN